MLPRSTCRPRRPPRVRSTLLLASAIWWGVSGLASAQGRRLLAVATIAQTVTNITDWIVGLLAGLATMFLTIGGLRYLMAEGEPGEVEKAKGALKSAGIGYMLALMAPVIVGVLKSLVGA
jgi:hypothetical protein